MTADGLVHPGESEDCFWEKFFAVAAYIPPVFSIYLDLELW